MELWPVLLIIIAGGVMIGINEYRHRRRMAQLEARIARINAEIAEPDRETR